MNLTKQTNDTYFSVWVVILSYYFYRYPVSLFSTSRSSHKSCFLLWAVFTSHSTNKTGPKQKIFKKLLCLLELPKGQTNLFHFWLLNFLSKKDIQRHTKPTVSHRTLMGRWWTSVRARFPGVSHTTGTSRTLSAALWPIQHVESVSASRALLARESFTLTADWLFS